jgi:uncharacterized protein (DUF983 family)
MTAGHTDKTLKLGGRAAEERPLGRSIKRGLLNTCPNCGTGRLFQAFLKPVDHCAVCGEDMTHQRADDLPAYLVILILGHVLLGGYMMTDLVYPASAWLHLAIWTPIGLATALATIQPVKGAVIGLQWALRMHGFGAGHDEPEEFERETPAP